MSERASLFRHVHKFWPRGRAGDLRSPKRPVMEGVDAVAGEAAHVGASYLPTTAKEAQAVVHPHGCPKCGSFTLFRRSTHFERIQQPLDHIENFYGGIHGLRAVVASGAPQTVVSAGVNAHAIRCGECDHEGLVLDFVTEVQSG